MYRRLFSAVATLLIGIITLVNPSAAAAEGSSALCYQEFCASQCPSDVQAFCEFNLNPGPCPGEGEIWTYVHGQCDDSNSGDACYPTAKIIKCSYTDP